MSLRKIPVAVFAEGSFEKDKSNVFGTQEAAEAFSEGVGVGASMYGCGSCGAYALPNQLDDMKEDEEDADEVALAIAWANEESGLEMTVGEDAD